jgi:hypothetical protein
MRKPARNSLLAAGKAKTISFDLAQSASVNRIEGLVMSKDMQRMFQGFELSGLSHDARRAALKNKYGKFSG